MGIWSGGHYLMRFSCLVGIHIFVSLEITELGILAVPFNFDSVPLNTSMTPHRRRHHQRSLSLSVPRLFHPGVLRPSPSHCPSSFHLISSSSRPRILSRETNMFGRIRTVLSWRRRCGLVRKRAILTAHYKSPDTCPT